MKTIKKLESYNAKSFETLHINDRSNRLAQYGDLLSTQFIECYEVDKNHEKGNEIHCINVNGLIYVYNKNTQKFITVLHARPAQLKRYAKQLNIEVSKEVKKLCRIVHARNEKQNLNNK